MCKYLRKLLNRLCPCSIPSYPMTPTFPPGTIPSTPMTPEQPPEWAITYAQHVIDCITREVSKHDSGPITSTELVAVFRAVRQEISVETK